MKLNVLNIVFFLLISTFGYGQLSDFVLNTTHTNETCQGNGSITSTLSNTTSGAEIVYKVYKLPNLSIPISGQAIATSLVAGDYKVVVTQSLGNSSNSQEKDVTIINQIVDLTFDVSSITVSSCATSGTIVVTVLTGTAVTFELKQGSQLIALQSSNIFSGLAPGLYRIRVFDVCGVGVPKDFTLLLNTTVLNISLASTPPIATSCTDITVVNTITPSTGTLIIYPLTVVYTIHPPGGAPDQTITQIFSTGPSDVLDLTLNLPLFANLTYTYDIKVTDNCGIEHFSLNNLIDPLPKVILSDLPALCDNNFLEVLVSNFFPPYSISFIQSPTGFIPSNFNVNHPGPFVSGNLEYGGINNPLPFGTYQVQIEDSCGRIVVSDPIILEDIKLIPIKSAINLGCGSLLGRIKIQLPNTRKIVSAIIINGPIEYQPTPPHNVSSFINVAGELFITNIPIGIYNFELVDECGKIYFVEVTIPPFVNRPLISVSLPNCDPGTGSVKVSSGNGALTSIIMTVAPSTFLQTFPFDVSFNISSLGVFLMNDLPAGNYTFTTIDICGFQSNITIAVVGYNRSQPGFSVERNCGSYNLTVNDSSNGVTAQNYWLQKLNTNTNSWEHPDTSVVYIEGTLPNTLNSRKLINNSTYFNLIKIGKFRIIKTFQSFNNGNITDVNKDCIDLLGEFDFTDGLTILGAYSLDCPGGAGISTIVIDVEGVPPYNFSITKKDDLPFILDNGNNNIFVGLDPGKYEFLVEDFCTATKPVTYTLGNLPKLVNALEPQNLLICNDILNQNAVFDLTLQESSILGSQNPQTYTVSYHLTSQDAENGNAPIQNPKFFLPISNPQTIYVRVIHNTLALCYDTTSFQVFIGITPVLQPSPTIYFCTGSSETIYADVNNAYDAYLWSTGETTSSIVVNDDGIYTVVVKNEYGSIFCESLPKDITVLESGIAKFESITTLDWTEHSNTITVVVSGNGVYEYSLDNINFQDQSFFSDLDTGLYTVYVKDKYECGTIKADVVLLNYPKFFTPNNDGFNDKWQIKFSVLEPDLIVYIYDRMGKLITGLDSKSSGWDGTLNGYQLPSTDYWFVAERADGKIYKGHFAMKR